MSNYATLKSAIQSVIKTNGNNGITGQLLQNQLIAMVNTLGYGYQFMGIASPNTSPGTPDAKVFYIAFTPGTYTNFGGIVVTGLCVLKYASGWSKEDITISGGGYTLPIASANTLGGIKVGQNLSIDENGVLSAVSGGVNFTVEDTDLSLISGSPQKLKFADRLRETNIDSGLNYVILRKTSSFATQIANVGVNSIFEIRYDFDLNNADVTIPANSVLYFNGGKLTNGNIKGRPIIKAPLVKIFDNVTFENGIRGNFRVEWFGAIPDGVTDSAPGIRACIASVPDSDFVIEFSPGKYIQGDGNNVTPCCFDIENKSRFVIKGNGAEIQANAGNSCIQNNRGFYLVFCRDAVIENIKYDGNILERKPAMGDSGSINRQSAFDLRGCTRVSLISCSAIGAIMDGFFIGYERNQQSELVYSDYCKLINCFSEKSYRQGITVAGGNYGVIDGCVLKDIGTTPYSTSPRCGIDLEDGYNNGQDGWSITNTEISGCAGSALSLSAGTRNTHVVSCSIDGTVFHNDNNDPDSILGNIISNCLIKNTTIYSYCPGLSLVNNEIIGASGSGNLAALYFSNLNNFEIKSIDKIFGNNIKFEWDPSTETYTSGTPSTVRGISLLRPLDFENNILENFSGVNPIYTNVAGYPLKNVRKFNHNTIRSSYDVTQYGGARIASFTGQGAIQGRIYHDNIVEGLYPALQENLFDVFNSPNDLRRFYKFPYLQVKGENWIYDICLGQFSLLKNPTYIRVMFDETAWYMLTKGNGTAMTYKIEKGTSANDLLFSELYQDTDGFAHILINSSSGGYFYPIIELFWKGGALPPDTGKYFYMTRRTKTAEDAAKTYTAPTLDTPTQ